MSLILNKIRCFYGVIESCLKSGKFFDFEFLFSAILWTLMQFNLNEKIKKSIMKSIKIHHSSKVFNLFFDPENVNFIWFRQKQTKEPAKINSLSINKNIFFIKINHFRYKCFSKEILFILICPNSKRSDQNKSINAYFLLWSPFFESWEKIVHCCK